MGRRRCGLEELVLSFDRSEDGRISRAEFDDFLRWAYAKSVKKYFDTPCVPEGRGLKEQRAAPAPKSMAAARSALSGVGRSYADLE